MWMVEGLMWAIRLHHPLLTEMLTTACWMDCLPGSCGVHTPQLGLSSVLGYEFMSQSALAALFVIADMTCLTDVEVYYVSSPQCDMFKIWVGIWKNEKNRVVFAWNWVLNYRPYSLSPLYRGYIIYHLSVISLIWYLYIMSIITLVPSLLWLYHLASISLSCLYHPTITSITSLSSL